ncbi:MAG: right-handed parallel beta-helix repeat-containing protein [Deltaproteobacteria bacterium]
MGPQGEAPEDIYVLDLGRPQALMFDLPRADRRLEAFIFRRTVEQLGLEPGRNTLKAGEPPNPDDYTAFAAEVSGSDDVVWSEESMPQWVDRLTLPAFDGRRCLTNGGCLIDNRCKIPCEVEVTPTPPTPPHPPERACPSGWSEVLESVVDDWPDGALPVHVCRPWTERPECVRGTLPSPGGTCTPMADVCPTAEFPPDAAGVDNHYVRENATPGGDGSRGAPHATLAEALAAATPPARVVLGAGAHDVMGDSIPDGVEVRGVCPEQVELRGRLVVPAGAGVEIRALAFDVGGLDVLGTATVSGVLFDAATAVALDVGAGGDATLQDVGFSGVPTIAMRVAAGAELRGTHVVVGNTERALAIDGATVDFTQLLVEVADEELAVLSTESDVTLRESYFDGGSVRFEDSSATLTDVLVTNTARRDAVIGVRSALNVRRLHVVDAQRIALAARVEGSLVAQDVVIVRAARVDGTRALVTSTVSATLDRVAILESSSDGIAVAREPLVTLRDIIVHDAAGRGVRTDSVNSFSIQRAHLTRLGGPGIQLFDGEDTQLDDITVRDAGSSDCWDAAGIRVRKQTSAQSNRVDLRQLHGRGILVNDGTLDLADAWIEDVQASGQCSDGVGLPPDEGTGIHFIAGAGSLSRFVITDAAAYGVRIIGEEVFFSSVRASEGIVRGSNVGLEVGVVAPTYEAYIDRVDFADNGVILLESGAAL